MRKILLSAAAVVILTSCAIGPDYAPPKTNIPAAWKARDEKSKEAHLVGWWKQFNDKTLNQLVEQAYKENLDKKAAQARLKQARASYGVAVADFFPTGSYSGSAARVGASANAPSGTGADYNLYTSGFDASWELDIFGGKRRALEAAKADIEAKQEDVAGAEISLIAEVAVDYINLRMYQKRLEIARRNMELQYKMLDLLQSRAKSGLNSSYDVLQAKAALENTRALVPQLATQVTQAKNALAVLLGKNPGSLDALLDKPMGVPNTNIKIVIGVPADMLRSRPDINKAERELAAATARIGVKEAELLPRLSLGGSIGLESVRSSNLFSKASQTFGFSSGVVWSIFDAGRIMREVALQKYVKEEAFVKYHATVLKALEDSENAITSYTNNKLREKNFERALQAADGMLEIANSKYKNGLEGLAFQLDAEQKHLSAQDAYIASKGTSAVSIVGLYKALGGGWENFGRKP